MKAAVVYFSRWGNCERVAVAIAKGLATTGIQARAISVRSGEAVDPSVDLVVIGSATRGGKPAGPVKRFIKEHTEGPWLEKKFAAFGTGMASGLSRGGEISADEIHKALRGRGIEPLMPPFKASVTGMKGPLARGEDERAFAFGAELGSVVIPG